MLSKSDKTKMLIIEKSAPLFNTRGYAATSMADILTATGLTKGGFYGNFKSKEEIAAEAFDFSLNKLKEGIRFKVKQQATYSGKLIAIFEFYHNYSIYPMVEGGCPLLNTAIDADDTMPALKEKAHKAMDEMLGTFNYLLEKGIAAGEFKKDLKVARESELIFSIIEGGMMMSKLSNNPTILNRLLDHLREQVKTRYCL